MYRLKGCERRVCSATVTRQDLPQGALLLWRLAALCISIMRHTNVARPCAYLTDSRWCRRRHHGRSSTVRLLGVCVFWCLAARVFKATCGIRVLRARIVAVAVHRRYGDIDLCRRRKGGGLSRSIGANWGEHGLCLCNL